MRTLLSLVLVVSGAGCLGLDDHTASPPRNVSGTWVPRSERPSAYDCNDDTSSDPSLWGEEIVQVSIVDDQGRTWSAGTPCAWAGFTAEYYADAKDLQLTFVVKNATYAYPPVTVDVPGPFHDDLDLGHVAITPATRSTP